MKGSKDKLYRKVSRIDQQKLTGAPDVVVYVEVAALKRTRVFRTELSSLDVNKTTLPLIKYSRGLQRHTELANMEVVTENKLYDTYASEELRVPWV